MSLHYNNGKPLSKLKIRQIASEWQPWRTVATWYLWRSLDPIPVDTRRARTEDQRVSCLFPLSLTLPPYLLSSLSFPSSRRIVVCIFAAIVRIVGHHDEARGQSRFSSSIRSSTPSAVWRSRLPVGSSASTQAGSVTSARASAARWRSPPDSSPGVWRHARRAVPHAPASRARPGVASSTSGDGASAAASPRSPAQ